MSDNKVKVLLIKAPSCDFPDSDFQVNGLKAAYSYSKPVISTALALLSSFVKEYGEDHYEVTCIDPSVEELLEDGKDKIDVSTVHDKVSQIIAEYDYDVLAVSVMFSANAAWAQYICALSRDLNPDKKIIIGGGYSTIYPEQSLMDTKCDYVVIGEGEDTFLFLLNNIFNIQCNRFDALFSNISGYAYVDQELNQINVIPKTTFIENLDLIPAPDWDMCYGPEYFSRDAASIDTTHYYYPILTTRGCPYLCTFCSVAKGDGRAIRSRSLKSILDEIQTNYNKYKFRNITFTDDDANVNKALFNELLAELILLDLPVQYEVFYVAINALTEKTIDLMSRLGMKKILLPIESGSPRIQKLIKKNIKIDKALRSVKWAMDRGMNVSVNFMIGFPQETMEDIQMTLNLARKVQAHQTSIWVVTPWQGTELYDYARDNGYLSGDIKKEMVRGYRDVDHFINVDFDYGEIKTLSYDLNIEVNFLNHSFFGEKSRYDELYLYWHNLEWGLNRHPVLFVCLGYLSCLMSDHEKEVYYYEHAKKLFGDQDIYVEFGKYLDWEFDSMNHFKKYYFDE